MFVTEQRTVNGYTILNFLTLLIACTLARDDFRKAVTLFGTINAAVICTDVDCCTSGIAVSILFYGLAFLEEAATYDGFAQHDKSAPDSFTTLDGRKFAPLFHDVRRKRSGRRDC